MNQIKLIDGKLVVVDPRPYPKIKITNVEFLKKKILESPTKKLSISCKQGANVKFIRLYVQVLKGEEKTDMTVQPGGKPIDLSAATDVLDFTIHTFMNDITITDHDQNSIYDIQIELSDVSTEYEPYTGGKPTPSPEHPQKIENVGKRNDDTGKYNVDVVVSDGTESGRKQTVTITSDRPITRYDSLVKQDGVYGWLYEAKEVILSSFTNWALPNDNRPDDRTRRIFVAFPDAVPNQHCYSEEYKSVEPNVNAIKTYDYECIAVSNGSYLTLKIDKNIGTTLKEYVEYFKQNDSKVLYHSVNKDFVPLPEEEQILLKSLSTYYPTTVVTVDGGEVYGGVELTYTADTKNYIDNQIKAVTGKQIETNKLILERMI